MGCHRLGGGYFLAHPSLSAPGDTLFPSSFSAWPIAPRGAAVGAGILPTRYDEDGNVVLGDIIVAIDSQPVKSTDDLYKILDNHQVGDEVQLEVIRGGRRRTLTVKLLAI